MIRCKLKILIAEKETEEERRISYADISEATGLSVNALSALANNKVTRYYESTLNKLCEYFDAGVGDVLEYVPEPATKGDGHQREPVAEAEAA